MPKWMTLREIRDGGVEIDLDIGCGCCAEGGTAEFDLYSVLTTVLHVRVCYLGVEGGLDAVSFDVEALIETCRPYVDQAPCAEYTQIEIIRKRHVKLLTALERLVDGTERQ